MLIRRNFVRNRIDDNPKNGKDRRVDMTPDVYGHLLKGNKEKPVDKLSKLSSLLHPMRT